jgi:hypothetical protein
LQISVEGTPMLLEDVNNRGDYTKAESVGTNEVERDVVQSWWRLEVGDKVRHVAGDCRL